MRVPRLPILFAVLMAGAATTASAQSLEARRMQAQRQGQLDHALELTNKTCGTSIKGSYAWSTFDAAEVQEKDASAWCQAALDAMEDLCSDAMGKAAVAAKVKALSCGGAATPSATLAPDGTLTFLFSLGPNQNKLLVRDYLDKNL